MDRLAQGSPRCISSRHCRRHDIVSEFRRQAFNRRLERTELLREIEFERIEVEHFGAVMEAGGWQDVTRKDIASGKLYSWWSYRSPDWNAADKGRRLDHIWATPDIVNASHGSRILRPVRGWEQPSDHAPVFATFDL